jgi:hypothetical protein
MALHLPISAGIRERTAACQFAICTAGTRGLGAENAKTFNTEKQRDRETEKRFNAKTLRGKGAEKRFKLRGRGAKVWGGGGM